MALAFASASSHYAEGSSGDSASGGSADRTTVIRFRKTVATDQCLCSHGNPANGRQFYIFVSSSQITVGCGGYNSNVYATAYTCDGLVHEIVAKSISGSFYIYVDGVYVTSGTQTGQTFNTTNPDTVIIGAGNPGAPSAHCDAIIDRFGMWNMAIDADQIAELWANPGPFRIGDLPVCEYYLLGEDGATASGAGSIKDWSGHGHHITPYNGPTFEPSPIAV